LFCYFHWCSAVGQVEAEAVAAEEVASEQAEVEEVARSFGIVSDCPVATIEAAIAV
jgi:hypothetical protein